MNQKAQTLRVVIVDDEAPARQRLRDLLADCEAETPLVIAGEAASGRAALELLAREPADAMMLDIRMPEMDGIEVAQYLGDALLVDLMPEVGAALHHRRVEHLALGHERQRRDQRAFAAVARVQRDDAALVGRLDLGAHVDAQVLEQRLQRGEPLRMVVVAGDDDAGDVRGTEARQELERLLAEDPRNSAAQSLVRRLRPSASDPGPVPPPAAAR